MVNFEVTWKAGNMNYGESSRGSFNGKRDELLTGRHIVYGRKIDDKAKIPGDLRPLEPTRYLIHPVEAEPSRQVDS